MAAVHHVDLSLARQLLCRQYRVLAGAGQFRADVDVDDVIALRQKRGEKCLERFWTDRCCFGQGAVPAVIGVQLRRGVVSVIREDTPATLDSQGYGADMEALQQLGRQVTGAVVGDADRSGHGVFLLFFLW